MTRLAGRDATAVRSYLEALQDLGFERLGNGRELLACSVDLACGYGLTGYDALYAAGEADGRVLAHGRRASTGARPWKALSAALGVVAALAGSALLLRPSAPLPEPLRFVVPPPPGILRPRSTMGLPLAAAPDGRRVASGGLDNCVLIWDPDELQPFDYARAIAGQKPPPQPFVTLAGHKAAVHALAFSQDGKRLVSGSHDNSVIAWDASAGAMIKTLRGHDGWVQACSLTADDRLAVCLPRACWRFVRRQP